MRGEKKNVASARRERAQRGERPTILINRGKKELLAECRDVEYGIGFNWGRGKVAVGKERVYSRGNESCEKKGTAATAERIFASI